MSIFCRRLKMMSEINVIKIAYTSIKQATETNTISQVNEFLDLG